jgi:hypothetical protein
VWLQAATGLGFRHWNFFLFSVARCNGLWFVGLFGVWLPLPFAWLGDARDRLLDLGQVRFWGPCVSTGPLVKSVSFPCLSLESDPGKGVASLPPSPPSHIASVTIIVYRHFHTHIALRDKP